MVLVSHQHKFIFIKTHKTASTSTEMFFEPACAPPGHEVKLNTRCRISDYGIIGGRAGREGRYGREEALWKGHIIAPKIREQLPPEQWNGYRKFANVRNPFDRALSKFLYRRREEPPITEFDTFIREFDAFLFDPAHYKADINRVHIKGEYILDDVIRFEDLAGEVLRVGATVGFKPDVSSLAHARDNKSARLNLPNAAFFSPQRRERVLQVDKWMFDRCGYSPNPDDA